MRAHATWAVSDALRRGALVHRSLVVAARHPAPLTSVLPCPAREYFVRKAADALLPLGRYRELAALADQALSTPGSDGLGRGLALYYRAHAARYLDHPEDARADLAKAASLLVESNRGADVERYAGVLLEQGIVALTQARPGDALRRAADLVDGPGRYAIGRWSGWGHWLASFAHLYRVPF